MSFTSHKSSGRNRRPLQLPRPLQLSPPPQLSEPAAPAFRPRILRSLRLHPLVAASVAAVVLLGMLAFALRQASTYQAVSQVFEEPASSRVLGDKMLGESGASFDATRYDAFLGEQIQLVQRIDVLKAAILTLPRSTWQDFGPTLQAAAENLQTDLKVQRLATTYQISISLKGSDPVKTAAVVNAVTSSYLEAVGKASASESDQRSVLLAEERQRIETELQSARSEQTLLGASIGVASPGGDTGNPFDSELSGIRAQLTEARAAHEVAAAQLASLSGPASSGLAAAADEAIAGDAGLGSMKATVSARKAQLAAQMVGMTPTNPVFRQDQDELAGLDRTLDRTSAELRDQAARRLQSKLRTDLARTGDIESRLNNQLARQIARATGATPKLQRATELSADIQRLYAREAAFDDALRGLRLDSTGPAQVRLALAATPPEHPEANRKRLLLLLALPLALFCGVLAAVLMRKADARVFGGLDVEEVLGFAPLAVLPARADVPGAVFEEYVLRLAAGIESACRTDGARTFLLTAVSLKTDLQPLASALTRKFQQIGVDVAVASASSMLAPISDASAQELATMAAAGEGFVAGNVARLKTEHGLVLIQSDALLHCAQTEYVARCADATILVVESGVTTRTELYSAAQLLQRLRVSGVGTVLEQLRLCFADSSFKQAVANLSERPPAQDSAEKPVARHVKAPLSLIPREESADLGPAVHAQDFKELEVPHDHPLPMEALLTPEFSPLLLHPEGKPEEIPSVTPVNPVAESNLHEKMTSMRSAETQEPIADGEPMTHSSWFDRLLGRDADSSVSIVPVHDQNTVPLVAGAADPKPLPTLAPEELPEPLQSALHPIADDDIPTERLAARLQQVSRQHAPPSEPERLHLVPSLSPHPPPQQMDGLPLESTSLLDASPASLPHHQTGADATPEPLPHRLGTSEPEDAYSTLEDNPATAAPPTPEPAPKPPRRPLTFHELSSLAQKPLPQAASPLATEFAPQPAPENLRPEVQVLSPATAQESAPQAAAFPHPPLPTPAPAPTPKPNSWSNRVEDEWARIASPGTPATLSGPDDAPSLLDADDIFPVYREASRTLTTGRWDPIPTLRPGVNGWRDRPSGGHAISPSDSLTASEARPKREHRWSDSDEELNRWVSDTPMDPALPADPLPAPVLTRQWGLLSKFQQQRISKERPVAEPEEEPVVTPSGERRT